MTRTDAIHEARMGALLCGGTWLVTCKAEDYGYTEAERFESGACGTIAEVFAPFTVPRYDSLKAIEA